MTFIDFECRQSATASDVSIRRRPRMTSILAEEVSRPPRRVCVGRRVGKFHAFLSRSAPRVEAQSPTHSTTIHTRQIRDRVREERRPDDREVKVRPESIPPPFDEGKTLPELPCTGVSVECICGLHSCRLMSGYRRQSILAFTYNI